MSETFQKIEKIGEGTYGVVYKAREKSSGRIVALKKVRLSDDREGVPATTIREISLLKNLKHPHIIALYEVIYTENKLYLVFEYAEIDLKKYLDYLRKERRSLGREQVRDFAYQLVSALQYCHSIGILHRDLKPQNILITGDKIKLADFGLGRLVGVPLHTLTCEVVTLWYRPPEILLGAKHYATSVDVWSLGCIIAEFVLLKPLFPGDSEIDQLYKIFQVLGTPNEQRWEGVTALKNFQPEFPLWEVAGVDLPDKECQSLVNDLLVYNPMERPSAKSIMMHPYFQVYQ
ncbi:cyclin-dependent kinase 2 [Nematocida homosporus]|uniref:cyclin-dependent kinase 2 n=1 Tax=Nematocida homosporus TaxID=1912981 RepID=UPI00222012C0|nr:cyclin-dependent kinase 2 [Nematocida homosporus]KAI5187098.1 cyclin-dependent kinase 2 [Nematocida homosporus]